MQPIERKQLATLMGFHLLWGLVLWFSISKLGLGLSTDSVHLLFAGLNLSEGRGLVSFNGSPVLGWPPLYPVLLGALHLLTGTDTFTAAHVLQGLAFIGLSVCLALLFLRIFPEDFALAIAGTVLADIGAVVVISFGLVGSDYVELFLMMFVVLLAAQYVQSGSPRTFMALFVAAMLAMLQRYLGIAAIGAAVLCILLFAKAPLGQRVLRSLFLSLSVLPAGVWLLETSSLVQRRGPITFAENFMTFSQSVLQWFLPESIVSHHPHLYTAMLWILLIGLVVLLYRAGRTSFSSFAASLLSFGLLYLLALFGSASVSYYNKLAGRFLLPLYIPFIALLLLGMQAAWRLAIARWDAPALRRTFTLSGLAILALAAFLALRVSIPVILQSHAGAVGVGENAFNTLEWRNKQVFAFWQAHKPAGDYLLISNEPDAVAFYAAHSSTPSPRKYSGPYGTVKFPLESYTGELFSSGQDVYLIWIKTGGRSYYYGRKELGAIADLEPLFRSRDGAVFRLRQRVGG
jgi:hypothetical protein